MPSTPLSNRAKTPIQSSFLALDEAYDRFVAALNECLRLIEASMVAGKVSKIGLGAGIPKKVTGPQSGVTLVSLQMVSGKLVLFDRAGEKHPLRELDTESLHFLVARVRGTQQAHQLGM